MKIQHTYEYVSRRNYKRRRPVILLGEIELLLFRQKRTTVADENTALMNMCQGEIANVRMTIQRINFC